MSAGRSACLCWTLLSVCLLASSSAEETNIRAEAGKNEPLPCKGRNNDPVTVVEWRRTDPQPEDLLSYRNGEFIPVSQNSSYQNRVDLQDRQMKDGDVSLILKNVKTEDSGTYECYVVQNKRDRRKRAIDPITISIIRLEVVPPGHTDEFHRGHLGLIAGLTVAGVVVAGFLIFRGYKHRYHPPPE